MSLVRLVFGNWFSRAYLLLVAAVGVFVAISLATYDGPDANLVGVWLFFVTAPWSLAGIPLADTSVAPVALIGGAILGALINAALIGLVVRLFRRRDRRTADVAGR